MYKTRVIEGIIRDKLSYTGAIQIEGPKWCGKSTTASLFAQTIVKLQDPIVFHRYEVYASTSKNELLTGKHPILFDEWQKIPDIWDFVRLDVDDHPGEFGRFILTGSAKPLQNDQRHTGTGRITRLKMRTMSLYESGESSGGVSLEQLFNDSDYYPRGESKLTISDQVDLVCKGGWPGILNVPVNQSLKIIKDYFESLLTTDISDIDGVKRNPALARRILKSYARAISTLTDYQTMLADIAISDGLIDQRTLASYLSALEKLFIIEPIEAWTPKLRSASKIRTKPKKQFVDPSIAVVALGASRQELLEDLETFGFFFESLVTRDLRIYTESLGGSIFHYRDNTGLEVDNIIRLNDGRWAAVEIKLGSNKIDEAAANLIKLTERVDTDQMLKPSFLMVVYGGQYAYKRPDGVYVIPLGCLKP